MSMEMKNLNSSFQPGTRPAQREETDSRNARVVQGVENW